VRGNDITMIFQEPMTSLNPLHTIERQIGEILQIHRGLTGAGGRGRTLELLDQVGIRDAESRLGAYPHQLVRRPAPARDDRHGARQRPRTADRRRADDRARRHGPGADPRTAAGLQRQRGMSMLFITHDLGIVRKISDRVCVMQAGKIVEQGPTAEIFADPRTNIPGTSCPPSRRAAAGPTTPRRW
jgi:microcin C transport system ATP-binding protein